MNVQLTHLDLLLFVPADRPDRFSKAAASGADGVIVDLEDAIRTAGKDAARLRLAEALASLDTETPILVRINSVGTPWHDADLELVAGLPVAGVVLPKAECDEDIIRVAQTLGGAERVVALVETAAGVACARSIAVCAGRIAFGSYDYAADVGAAHSREALLHARSELVLACRLAGRPGPVDGVTATLSSASEVESDAAFACSLGFAGKLLVHPSQVRPAMRGFAPSTLDLEWAQRVANERSAVAVVDDAMVDAPMRVRAEQIIRRAARWGER